MGFYIEFARINPGLYRESQFPSALWFLYGFSGVALLLMGASTYSLLFKLAGSGDAWDIAILLFLACTIPLYLIVGFRLFFLRKFVQIGQDLVLGYFFRQTVIGKRCFLVKEILRVDLINHRPSSNLAPLQHGDSQYFIRGHWRVVLKLVNGRSVVLDQHTEKEMLEGLYKEVHDWLKIPSGHKDLFRS